MIDHEENVAAIIVEPIVGTNGVLVPPDRYLPSFASSRKKHGVLLIADEVMTRLGPHRQVVRGRSLGRRAGHPRAPRRASPTRWRRSAWSATSRAIADHFEDNFFAHGHTYEAHPLTLAPAIAAIDEYKRLDLIDRSREMGELLGEKLARARGEAPVASATCAASACSGRSSS